MSTGITYPIEKRAMGLREYLERCWALCSRGHHTDAPLPTTIGEDPSYAIRLADAQSEVEHAEAMTDDAIAAELATLTKRNETIRKECRDRAAIKRHRYDDLIAAIESWDAPPDAIGYRDMALRHARESRDFDCPADTHDDTAPMTPQDWRADKIAMAARSLERATDALTRHRENIRQANAVLIAIRAVPSDR